MSRRGVDYQKKIFQEAIPGLVKLIVDIGIDGYLLYMVFNIALVGLARIILKIFAKQNYKYSNLFIFCIIGLIISTILKMFKFDLSSEPLEFLICLILNILFFILFKCKNKILR